LSDLRTNRGTQFVHGGISVHTLLCRRLETGVACGLRQCDEGLRTAGRTVTFGGYKVTVPNKFCLCGNLLQNHITEFAQGLRALHEKTIRNSAEKRRDVGFGYASRKLMPLSISKGKPLRKCNAAKSSGFTGTTLVCSLTNLPSA
jgi:hypothetical protein